MAALGRMVALAAACEVILLLFGAPLAAALAALTGGNPAGTLLATAVLFGPASVLLATVSPWAVRIAARDLGQLGHTAGRLFALSTLGSLAGTLACTFLLIPFLELRQILGLLTALTALTACVAFAGSFRAEAPAAALAALLLVGALPAASLSHRGAPDLIYERVTPYQTLQVYERDGVRTLRSDRVPQAAVRLADRQSTHALQPRRAGGPADSAPHPRRALIIGLGGGTVGRYLQAHDPAIDVQYVDIDPAVLEIAKRFFFFQPGPRMRVTVADGRQFLHASTGNMGPDLRRRLHRPERALPSRHRAVPRRGQAPPQPRRRLRAQPGGGPQRSLLAGDVPHGARPLRCRLSLPRPPRPQRPGGGDAGPTRCRTPTSSSAAASSTERCASIPRSRPSPPGAARSPSTPRASRS